MGGSPDTGRVAVEAVHKAFGKESLVDQPRKLAGGAVHDSWAVDATVDGVRHELVVRATPPGRVDHEKTRREFEVLRVAFSRGIRCPEPIAVGESETGEDYLLMTRVRGDTNPRQLLTGDAYAEARRVIIQQLAEDLARIHEITPDDVAAAPGMRGPEAGEDALAYSRRQVEASYRADLLNPHPAVEWAFRWLDRQIATLPKTGKEPCVVHGDFRIGNMLYDEQGLTSVLDWEGTHIGEPEEDLAWLCTRVWRFGKNELEAGGVAPREEWIQAYEKAAGRAISRDRVAAWEVLQNIRWCQITMMQARVHLDGNMVSHELAAIGRRTAETELEVLRLTGVEARVRNAG
ncbi:MAG: phosphotransferase family protein [Dehalococcoidia bacterium]|nr:phosphotransferase family protein [Dehalococcoidia bacterium]